MSDDIERVVKATVYKTTDGKIHETEKDARLHARMLVWFEFCERIYVTRSDAESIWDTRLNAAEILNTRDLG